jgi:hypothetical protein
VIRQSDKQEAVVLQLLCEVMLGEMLREACIGLEKESGPAYIVHVESYRGDDKE